MLFCLYALTCWVHKGKQAFIYIFLNDNLCFRDSKRLLSAHRSAKHDLKFVLLALVLYAIIAGPVLEEALRTSDVLRIGLFLGPLLLLGLSHVKTLRFGATLCFFLSLIYPLYIQGPRLSVSMTTIYALVYLGSFFTLLYLGERSLGPLSLEQASEEKSEAKQDLGDLFLTVPKLTEQTKRRVLARPRPSPPQWVHLFSPLIFSTFWLSGLVIIWASTHARIAGNVALVWTLTMTIAAQQYFWPLLISSDWLAYKTRRKAEAELKQKKTLAIRYLLLLVFGLGMLSYTISNT